MITVEVAGSVPRFSRRQIETFVRQVILAARRQRIVESGSIGVSIAFYDDAAMKALNRRFRHKNKTTDVLTFPADPSYIEPSSSARSLGDIAISIDQARRQARDERHSMATEVRYLLLHGILHALGFDHETDHGEMDAMELKLRRSVGLV